MENMKLNDQDLKLFGELFAVCDEDNSGKVSGPKASELFITSGLSHEVLHEIIILCGAKRLGHFGRSQFYIALKLIAAVQHGLPVSLESISSGRDIPLPILGKFDAGFQAVYPIAPNQQQQQQRISNPRFEHSNSMNSSQTLPTSPTSTFSEQPSPPISPQTGAQVHPASAVCSGPVKTPKRPAAANNVSSHHHHQHAAAAGVHHAQFPAEAISQAGAAGFPGQHFEGPAVMHHRAPGEKGWASFEDDNQGLISDEKKDWTRFTDSSRAETSSLSSESSVDDVWFINEELSKYYLNQFTSMQPDLKGLISGSVAKDFFEKSKLPVAELSKIWQLSDVNKDGALNLEEFNTAMHLVVCRINGVELPETLPPSLMPYVPFTNPDEPFASDLPPGSTLKRLTPSSPAAAASAHQWAPSYAQASPSSSVSSPGQKPTPLSFEFKPIAENQDVNIAHPVALRMSPDGQAFPIDINGKPLPQPQQNAPDTGGYNSQDLSPNDHKSPPAVKPADKPIVSLNDEHNQVIHQPTHLQGRPRPTPKKAQSVPAPGQDTFSTSLFPPPPSQDPSTAMTTSAGPEAPVPPPRTKSHSRSNSLDTSHVLNTTETEGDDIAPPVIPPRPKDGSSSNTEMSSSTVSATVTSPLEDRLVTPQHSGDDLDKKVLPKQDSEQKRDLRMRVKSQREKNLTLSRLNSELNQELQEVMEQRIALEIQMEHLRPYSGGGGYL